ncbi:MAG: elongation factor P hydroxylase, partial [Arsenophonus sp.]|nr:elongation factor P hydroxylase [Arsenophonus sp.]
RQVLNYLTNGIPARAERFIQALQLFYNMPPLVKQNFIYPEEL